MKCYPLTSLIYRSSDLLQKSIVIWNIESFHFRIIDLFSNGFSNVYGCVNFTIAVHEQSTTKTVPETAPVTYFADRLFLFDIVHDE